MTTLSRGEDRAFAGRPVLGKWFERGLDVWAGSSVPRPWRRVCTPEKRIGGFRDLRDGGYEPYYSIAFIRFLGFRMYHYRRLLRLPGSSGSYRQHEAPRP